jgi:hypothetical protein
MTTPDTDPTELGPQDRDTDPDIQARPITQPPGDSGWIGWVALALALCLMAVVAVKAC